MVQRHLKNGTIALLKHLSNNYENTDTRTKVQTKNFVILKVL
jgi:hypothetical protein